MTCSSLVASICSYLWQVKIPVGDLIDVFEIKVKKMKLEVIDLGNKHTMSI